jgi:hypothetical protein
MTMDSKVDLLLAQSTKAFEAEWERADRLTGRAERYLGAIAVVVGFGLVNIEDVLGSEGPIGGMASGWLGGASFLALLAAFLLALLALGTRDYWSYPGGETMVVNVAESEDYRSAVMEIVKMYFAAQEENSLINTRRAALIRWSGSALVLGFLLAIATRLIAA